MAYLIGVLWLALSNAGLLQGELLIASFIIIGLSTCVVAGGHLISRGGHYAE